MVIGAVSMVAMMLLIVSNVVYRLFGHIIVGSYELTEVLILISGAFALAYAAVKGSHVVVKAIVSRFRPKVQAGLDALMSFISLGIWGSILWATTVLISQRWLTEVTEMLKVPYLPFRFIWIIGLGIACLVYLVQLIRAVVKVVKP